MRKLLLLVLLCQGCIVIKPCGCDEKKHEPSINDTRNAIGNTGSLNDLMGGSRVDWFDKSDTGFDFKKWHWNNLQPLTDSLLKADTALQHKLQNIKQNWGEYMTPATHTDDLSTHDAVKLGGTLIIETKIK